MRMEPLISVIVPVYNVEEYLDECIESIVSQSYSHLEILVVDDGSTDSSGTMCDRWAERDERIRVIHQPNGGLSAARNSALDVMSGELVMMVDSDDVIHPKAIEILYDLYVKYGADITMGSYTRFCNDTPQWADYGSYSSKKYDQSQAVLAIFYQQNLEHSAWIRLYRPSLFDDIRYPVGLYYEDLGIIYPLLKNCSLVVKTDCILYAYRQRENSILESFSPKRADVLNILEGLEQQVLQEGDNRYVKAVRSRLLSAYFNILLLSHQDKIQDHKALQDRCWQGIKRLRNDCLLDPNVRAKNKLGIMASYGGRWLLCDILGHKYHPK